MTHWEGDSKLWRVEGGALTGGSLTEQVKENDFLASTRDYTNFVLRLQIKLTGTSGFINSGVQIRSERVPKSSEMKGYQCDFGDPNWWGAIYDEMRRNRVMSPSDMAALGPVIRRNDWNDYVIQADGPRITTWINGVRGTDYFEQEEVPDWGKIGIQIHGGGKALVQVRQISIEELPSIPASLRFVGAPPPKGSSGTNVLAPEMEQATFTLPPGFKMELVAAESEEQGLGKFVTVDWDTQGRMWSMTALEYPVDANESPAVARELYASRARDKVVVYDRPFGPGPHHGRVFAEGLAIPLGILPWRNGVYAQHGPDLVFLSDNDGDGKSDKREVILTGFGIQDSHLFPHQFTRAPGNWLWMAQGAFNYGKVKTSRGQEQQFDQTRMARFRSDGSEFEITSQGPCNIWGLVLTGEGEAFIQEANDYGYPVMPFHHYANYPGCSDGQFKSYAPEFPGTAPDFKMGGTGLSGLALSDGALWPAAYAAVMYLANPITRKIQAIRLHRDGAEYRLQKLPDFVQSSDEMFRPVAIKFGPDGCLYIVDWYNKIISHNEVPRNHPERDKKRGRIWRVRHEDQKRLEVPDFTRLPEVELLARLGHPALAQHHLAWQAIIDRGLTNQAPALRAIVLEKNSMATRRIGGLWALEGLQRVDRSLLENLLADPNRNIRREAIRVLGAADALWNPELVRPLLNDPDPQVRAEIIAAAGARAGKEIGALTLCAALARPALDGPMGRSTQSGKPIKVGEAYVREFERYLVRLFLEKEPEAVARFLASNLGKEMPLENRIWLSLAIDPRAGAREVAALVPLVQRAPSSEELLRIAQFPAEPGVAEAWQKILSDTRHRLSSVEQLMKVRSRFDAAPLRPLLSQVVSNLFGTPGGGSAAALQLITGFKLELFEPVLAQRLPSAPVQEQLLLLRALRELNSKRIDLFADLARRFPGLRDEALGALAAIKETKSAEASIKLWPELNPQQKRTLLSSLAGHASGAQALVSSLESGDLTVEDLDGGVVEKLQTVLAGEEQGAALIRQLGARLKPVLRLEGKDNSWVESGISLAGPFTVEAWVKLDPGIDNNDGLLGAPGVVDMNFHDGRFRVWVAGLNDLVVARKKVTPSSWTHLAVSRDGVGEFRIFLNGELDSTQSTRATNQWNDLRIAWTGPSQGTAGELAEFRIWNRPRTEHEIRNDFDRSYAASDGQSAEKTNGLVYWFGGTAWGKVQPGARVVKTLDYPALLTAEESRQQQEKFAAFRRLATRPGNLSQGEQIFKANCAVCHSVNGQGGQVGPVLNGAGAAGVESLLRNLLTPSAAMEAGYRAYRVELKNGELVEGIFQGENEQGILLRRPNVEDTRISPAEIKRAGYGKRSLMPEGMLEALPPSQVTDLMAYLLSLK